MHFEKRLPRFSAAPGFCTAACAAGALLSACQTPDSAPDQSASKAISQWFADRTADTGIDFVHRGGPRQDHAMPAIMGGGGAVFDYDNDGDLDLYLVQSGTTTPSSGGENHEPNRLYRQDPGVRFIDVTDVSKSGHTGYGMGAAVGDIDNDGDLDLFVTNLGRDVLLRNEGDGTFLDRSHEAGFTTDGWSMSAAFLDVDRDDDLDLYVTRYVRFDPAVECTLENGERDFCGPTAFAGVHDLLYLNNGDGTFTDQSFSAGLTTVRDAGLGVVAADLNADGYVDVYVANDAAPNNLWINQGDGTFTDQAVMFGAAVNVHGASEAGMGVALGDVNQDAHLDLLISHLIGESNTLYRSLESMSYLDATAGAGLATDSFDHTGFGAGLTDFDNDGALDAVVVNGAVKRRQRPSGAAGTDWQYYVESNLLFRGNGEGAFTRLEAVCGDLCTRLDVSRALMPADLDRDGGVDLVVTSIGGPTRVYLNQAARGHWLDVRLIIPQLKREATGATLATWTGSGCSVSAAVPLGGYLVGGHSTIHLGTGSATAVKGFEVHWPNGRFEHFAGTETDRVVELRAGEGEAHDGPSWSRPCA